MGGANRLSRLPPKCRVQTIIHGERAAYTG